jgi:hypothetical protein
MKTLIAALALLTFAASPTFAVNQTMTPNAVAEQGATVDGLLKNADRVLRGAVHGMDPPSRQAL